MQVAFPRVELAESVHGEPAKLPREAEKDTAPDGVIGVPAEELSITLTVQAEVWLMTIGLLQATLVIVVRRFTMIL